MFIYNLRRTCHYYHKLRSNPLIGKNILFVKKKHLIKSVR